MTHSYFVLLACAAWLALCAIAAATGWKHHRRHDAEARWQALDDVMDDKFHKPRDMSERAIRARAYATYHRHYLQATITYRGLSA